MNQFLMFTASLLLTGRAVAAEQPNVVVIFSSDNGPWSVFGNLAGRTPFREAKATGFNGGTQSPLIIR